MSGQDACHGQSQGWPAEDPEPTLILQHYIQKPMRTRLYEPRRRPRVRNEECVPCALITQAHNLRVSCTWVPPPYPDRPNAELLLPFESDRKDRASEETEPRGGESSLLKPHTTLPQTPYPAM